MESDPRNAPRHLTPDEFRRQGQEVVEWIARYMERLDELPVQSRVEPGGVRAQLPERAPERGEPFERVLEDLERVILPGLTHWQSPRFFGYFPANASGPAILGELVSAGLGVQGMLWSTSPACTELETHVLDWLVHALDLPAAFLSSSSGGGVIQDTASSAALVALVAARERATGFAAGRDGHDARLVVYASGQAHSSIEKAVRIAGFGSARLRLVETDAEHAMRPEALARAMDADRAAGLVPCCVVATCGTTASCAFDPIRACGEAARAHGAWLHVDAALAGAAALCPEHRGMHDGLELADSYCFNPHKWMLTNFDCDAFWVSDRATLVRALSVLPEYLRNAATESGRVIDYRDWQVPLGRRFRALKLWMVLRHYGLEGLRAHVRRHVALAADLAGRVEADARFELAAPPALNLVCFRLREGGDAANQALLDAINATGRAFLTHARLDGRIALRMALGGTWTGERHVLETWELARSLAR